MECCKNAMLLFCFFEDRKKCQDTLLTPFNPPKMFNFVNDNLALLFPEKETKASEDGASTINRAANKKEITERWFIIVIMLPTRVLFKGVKTFVKRCLFIRHHSSGGAAGRQYYVRINLSLDVL